MAIDYPIEPDHKTSPLFESGETCILLPSIDRPISSSQTRYSAMSCGATQELSRAVDLLSVGFTACLLSLQIPSSFHHGYCSLGERYKGVRSLITFRVRDVNECSHEKHKIWSICRAELMDVGIKRQHYLTRLNRNQWID